MRALLVKELREHVWPGRRPTVTFGTTAALTIATGITISLFTSLMLSRAGGLPTAWAAALGTGAGVAASASVAGFMAMNLGMDMVAGERERHTLETLLAGPLPDHGVAWAKVLAAATACAAAAASAGVGILVAMTLAWGGWGLVWGLLAIPAGAAGAAVPAFVMACLGGWAGLRTATLKDAGQRLMFVIFPLLMVPVLVSLGGAVSPGAQLVVTALLVLYGVAVTVGGPVAFFLGFRRARLLSVA